MNDPVARPQLQLVLKIIAVVAVAVLITSLYIALSTSGTRPPPGNSAQTDTQRLLLVNDLPNGWGASTSWSNQIENGLGELDYASFYQGNASDPDAWLSIELRSYANVSIASVLFANEVRLDLDSPAGAGCSNITLGDGALLIQSPEGSQGVNCSGYALVFLRGSYVCTINLGYKGGALCSSDFIIGLAQKELVKLGPT